MKAKKFFLILFTVLNWDINSYAQDGSRQIDGNNIDKDLLGSLFLIRLNQLRVQHGLNKLGQDAILATAAEDQAVYMNKTGVVGHIQKTRNKENPTARVIFYKGTNDRVGENCTQIYLHAPYKDKKDSSITVNTYSEAADALFMSWKNSKPHYFNMITPYYDVQGIGFSFDPKTNALYSSDVFGIAAYVPPKNFKVVDDAWGVGPGYDTYPNFFAKNLANFLHLKNDSVFFSYTDLDKFKQYIKNSNDGLAIDIVAHEQFNCNHNNNLHGSPVFDGWMLQPVYCKQLLEGNYYGKESNEIYTYLGKIPHELAGRDIQENVILIKNKHAAGYSFPVTGEAENLPMLRLDTYWDTTGGSVKPDTFNVGINHYVEFNRGVVNLKSEQIKRLLLRIEQYSKFINKIEIHTFSSIEGTTEGNLKLQKERADNIKAILSSHTDKTIEWQVEEKENWDAFYSQIEDTKYDYLKNYSKDVIKLMLRDPKLLDGLDAFLAQERTATVKFYLKGQYTSVMDTSVSRIALQDAIQRGDSRKAWVIQSKMIEKYEKGKMQIEDVIDNDVPVEKAYLPLLANIMAGKAVDIKYMFDPKFKVFVNRVFAIGKDYAPLKLSYCVCAINYMGANNDTLLDNKIIESYLGQCSKVPAVSGSIWRYYLDYYVAAAYYNWSKHKYGKLDTCLMGIQKYYPQAVLADTDYIKLGKLFNMYFQFDWTFNMLYPIVKKGTTNEDLLFLFISTAPLYLGTFPQDEFLKYLKQAQAMNPGRFCRWISEDNWQLLREDFIKSFYCEKCNDKE